MSQLINIPVGIKKSEDAILDKKMAICFSEIQNNERFKYADLTYFTNKNFVLAKRPSPDGLYQVINKYRLQHGDSILLVFVNGYFMPMLSDMTHLPQNVIRSGRRRNQGAKIDAQKYPFANLNMSMFVDGLFFYLPDQCVLSLPIHLLFIAEDQEASVAHPHSLFVFGEKSKAMLIEEHIALKDTVYMMNSVATMVLKKEANIEHYKIQQESKNAAHIAHTFVHQQQDSTALFMHFSSGSQFARDELVITLQGEGADCKTNGLYYLEQDNQYIDNQVEIHHKAPLSQSEVLYKGMIDKKSRAVFNGRLYVEKNARKILAYQANHNLLLSADAESYSRPELEIYADDVKCKHGASTGEIDREALFYLCSRGISKRDAYQMMLQGFADDIMRKVHHAGIKKRLQEMVFCP